MNKISTCVLQRPIRIEFGGSKGTVPCNLVSDTRPGGVSLKTVMLFAGIIII